MKKLAAYYLILLYAANLAKPVSIWFADVLAHGYFNQQHTGAIHEHGGTNHVHVQIGKAAKDDAPAQKASDSKNSEELTLVPFGDSPFWCTGCAESTPLFYKKIHLPRIFLSVPLPPPWPATAY